MAENSHLNLVSQFYDTHPINEQQIIAKLTQDGADLSQLTEDILQDYDQDHYGGPDANDVLAHLAGVDENSRVLDVCSGMGGPARYLAHNYGCRVTGIDLTKSRVASANRLTGMVGLDHRVEFLCANALDNKLPDSVFDVVISQEAFCHVPDKPRLVSECVRVLKVGGRIAFTDILARDRITAEIRDRLKREMTHVELATLDRYCELLEREGCSILVADDTSTTWTEILVGRLAMYRSLRGQTVARFGEAHFEQWDNAYSFFVGLYQSGELGGGRFLARRDG